MESPRRPVNEAARLEALRRYDLLDTLSDVAFDDLAALARHICGTPASLVSFVDDHRQWFTSHIGLAMTGSPRELSFCGHAILEEGVFVVPDAAHDTRFHDNPIVVGDPHIRFYAGAPLLTAEGHALGTLCVIDYVPRTLTAEQREALRVLSRQVMAQLDLRRQARELAGREARLRAALVHEGRYRTLFEYAPDGIVITDKNSVYLDANAAMCSIVGYERDELIGMHASQIVAEEEIENIGLALQMIRRHADYQREWRLRRKDGTLFAADVIATTMPDGNLLGVVRDMTERRTLEAQFQQSQKMEAIGRLAGGVAHDFNNLATVILGYCELLLADLEANDHRYDDTIQIQKAGMRAASLTRQLLAFSRRGIIEPIVLNLNAILGDMQGMLERLIGEDVAVVVNPGPDVAPIKADRGQIEQIVLNLAVNARDAMPDGGTLTIETANIELDGSYPKTHFAVDPGSYVALIVSDTGTGMTPDVQARLFEPFFTTKEVGKGTGLGLATVHGVVTGCGGSVDVQSEVGRGTSFKLYFPRVAQASVVEAPVIPAGPRSGAETVLIVEDAEGLRSLARRMLQLQGYTVMVAANADEAKQLFEQNGTIDVLLTDVVMPGASGPELSRRLIEQRPELKVIYMSGYTEDAIVRHGVLNPGIAFLHKPFTAESLSRKIREVLDH